MVYNGGNVKMRMHAWVEGFAKQDLSILISAAAVKAHTDKEGENSGDSVFNSLNPLRRSPFKHGYAAFISLFWCGQFILIYTFDKIVIK